MLDRSTVISAPERSKLRQEAVSVVEALEKRAIPTAEELDEALARVLALGDLELCKRVREVIRGWRAQSPSCDLCMAEALLTVGVPALAATQRFQARRGCDERCESLEVINNVFHGRLADAIAIAEKNDWFFDKIDEAAGVAYAMWALALCERCDEGWGIIERWTDHFARKSPEKYQMMLRVEAHVAAHAQRCARALSLLEDAHALCDEYSLDLARAFTEPLLATVYARTGDVERAHAIADRWPQSEGVLAVGPLAGARNLARMRIALLEDRPKEALHYGDLAMKHASAAHCAPLLCQVQFYRVLATNASQFPAELKIFRQIVHRYQIPYYLRRLNMLQQLVCEGHSPRDARVTIRTGQGCEIQPLSRLWMPRVEDVCSNIYYDRIQGVLYLNGHGPFFVGDQMTFKLLDRLVAQPDLEIGVAELYEEVWGVPYRQLQDEGKFHVTVHRLRSWLEQRGTGECRAMVQIQEGRASLCREADVRVVELDGPCGGRVSDEGLEQRLLALLAERENCPPKELEARLGISRSTLNELIRKLVDQGRVVRAGKGPATRYSLASA
jgi:hypothetical protein